MNYTVIRSRRRKKTLSIQVEKDGTVLVRVPLRVVQADIDRFLKEKKQWLLRAIGRQQKQNHDRLARVAMGFLGAPYRFGGSSVKGLDCSAFVKKIYAFFDINLPRTAREQARVGKRISRNDLEVGDLVFFNTRRAFGHVGVYIGNNEFVHASSGRARSVKVDTLDKPYYDKRFVKAVRLKTLDAD